jgi:hypothetical protein
MAIAVIQEFDASIEDYEKVNEKIAAGGSPEGRILHSGANLGGGKMKVVAIWESQEAWDKFVEERLAPTIGEVMGDRATQPSPPLIHELHDLVQD